MKRKLFYQILSFFQRQVKEREPEHLKRVLLANCAALGDLFLTTQMIPSIKALYPKMEIGVLIAPEARGVVEHHPDIRWIHECDYWLKPGVKKFMAYLRFHIHQKEKVAAELRLIGYDAALNFCPTMCDVQGIFVRSNIPHCVGFDTMGYQKLLTKKVPWNEETYLLHNFRSLVHSVGAKESWERESTPQVIEKGYVIFHIGSALKDKDLPVSFWKGLYKRMQDRKKRVYFTGKGQRRLIKKITTKEEENLSDLLTWEAFVSVIEHADCVYTVDTVTVHVAAALGTPHVVFYQATPQLNLWWPNAPNGFAYIKTDEKLKKRVKNSHDQMAWVDQFDPEIVQEVNGENRC